MTMTINQASGTSGARGGRSLLAASPLFRGLREDSLADLEDCSEVRRVAAREKLFGQGDPGRSVLILLRGAVKLTRRGGGVREHVVRTARKGEILGESLLFRDGAYRTTATALEDSSVLAIDARRLAQLLRLDPQLAWNLLVRLGARIDELQAHSELLATHTAEQKVAAHLMGRYRTSPPDDPVIGPNIRRSDLASLLALAPETLCRVIAGFRRRGWIRAANGSVWVADPGALAAIVPD